MRLERVREILAERYPIPPDWDASVAEMQMETVLRNGEAVAVLLWERIHAGLFLHIVAEPEAHGRWVTRASIRKHIHPKLRVEPIMVVIPSDREDLLSYAERMGCIHIQDGPISQLWVWPMMRG